MSKFSYEGKRVVVSGGGGAGMGAATVEGLAELGAARLACRGDDFGRYAGGPGP